MAKRYFIGGSPCSGKSTAAEILSRRYRLTWFKVDDHLQRYLSQAADAGSAVCRQVLGMTADEIWMRKPQIQCREEIAIYRAIFPLIQMDLQSLTGDVLAEGVAFLPELLKKEEIQSEACFFLIPSAQFQIDHYRARPWVMDVLRDCTHKELAFENWMCRDVMFGREMAKQCDRIGFRRITVDGSAAPEDIASAISAHFALQE